MIAPRALGAFRRMASTRASAASSSAPGDDFAQPCFKYYHLSGVATARTLPAVFSFQAKELQHSSANPLFGTTTANDGRLWKDDRRALSLFGAASPRRRTCRSSRMVQLRSAIPPIPNPTSSEEATRADKGAYGCDPPKKAPLTYRFSQFGVSHDEDSAVTEDFRGARQQDGQIAPPQVLHDMRHVHTAKSAGVQMFQAVIAPPRNMAAGSRQRHHCGIDVDPQALGPELLQNIGKVAGTPQPTSNTGPRPASTNA